MSGSEMESAHEQILKEPLRALRAGGLGFVGADVPVELLLASGRPFGHLPWRVDEPTPGADRWLESGFPGWSRSILEQWMAGAFNGLHGVLFSRADDAAQRLHYYIIELQARGRLGGPPSWLVDIALVPRESSVVHTAKQLEALGTELGIDPAAWPGALEKADALRVKLSELNAARGGDGPAHERLFRAALWSDATQWIHAVKPAAAAASRRVLLAGSIPPDDRLHRAAEAGGASIVDEMNPGGPARLGPVLTASTGTPALRVARHLQRHATGPRAFADRGAEVVARARAAQADAVILWLTREDEALAWQLPAQRRALEAAGIPLLALPAARWAADDGAPEAITRFCAEVRA